MLQVFFIQFNLFPFLCCCFLQNAWIWQFAFFYNFHYNTNLAIFCFIFLFHCLFVFCCVLLYFSFIYLFIYLLLFFLLWKRNTWNFSFLTYHPESDRKTIRRWKKFPDYFLLTNNQCDCFSSRNRNYRPWFALIRNFEE